jgi:hypothetical protein
MTREMHDYINTEMHYIKNMMNVDNATVKYDRDNDDIEDYVYTMTFDYDKWFHIEIQHVCPASVYNVKITIPAINDNCLFNLPITTAGGIYAVLMLISYVCEMTEF